MSKLRILLFGVIVVLSGCSSAWDFLLWFDYGDCESHHPYANVVEYSDKYADENSKHGTKAGESHWREEERFYSGVIEGDCANKGKQ